jgi:serine/threonine protein kinase
MLTSDGMLKVLDLGLANVLLEDEPVRGPRPENGSSSTGAVGEDLTGSRLFLGTPGFAPPEQIVSPRSVDGRADVYSLGMTLCYLLTGKGPARADGTECPVTLLRDIRSDVPDRFATLIGQMTEYARDRRPAMEEVSQRIAQIDLGDVGDGALSDLQHSPQVEEALMLRAQPGDVAPRPRMIALACGVVLMLATACLAWIARGVWTDSPATNGRSAARPVASPERPTQPPPYWNLPAAMLYISQERNPPAVYRMRPDGSGLETLYAAAPSEGVYIRGMVADVVNGWLYVNGSPRIFRMRFDGTQREWVSPPESVGPGDVMTLFGSHLFFMDGLTSLNCLSIAPESLQLPLGERRSHTLIDAFNNQVQPISVLACDVVGQQFYFDAMDREKKFWLMRWRGDESRPDRLISLSSGTRDLQCDYRRQILYWCCDVRIFQLDLTQMPLTPQVLCSPASKEIGHFAFDFARHRLYWVEVITGRVGEYNLEDGTSRLLLNDPDKFDHLREILVIPAAALDAKNL